MSTYNYSLFIVFAILATLIILDSSIASFITLIFKIIQNKLDRLKWMIVFHPNNFITTWMQNRKYDKIAKQLEQEFKEKRELAEKEKQD